MEIWKFSVKKIMQMSWSFFFAPSSCFWLVHFYRFLDETTTKCRASGGKAISWSNKNRKVKWFQQQHQHVCRWKKLGNLIFFLVSNDLFLLYFFIDILFNPFRYHSDWFWMLKYRKFYKSQIMCKMKRISSF